MYFDTFISQCIDSVNKLINMYPNKFKEGIKATDPNIRFEMDMLMTKLNKGVIPDISKKNVQEQTNEHTLPKVVENKLEKIKDANNLKQVLMFSDKTMNIYSPRRTRRNHIQSSTTLKDKPKHYSRVIHLNV